MAITTDLSRLLRLDLVYGWTTIPEEMRMVLHFRVNEPANQFICDKTVDDIKKWLNGQPLQGFNAALRNYLTSRLNHVATTVRRLDGAVASNHVSLTGLGNRGNHALPLQIAGLVHHHTGLPGASRRGRSYVLGPTIDHLNQGVPNTTYLNGLLQLFTELRTQMPITQPWQPTFVIWSPTLQSAADVTSSAVDLRFAQQRRRGRK